ncbi:FHA domain-containing serine/threonine-protein kinase [Dictyobacter kobayashii]|uniref:non-specific serine/threonine protein kinase n=1 Tax=Dictyobacter kobayashii TaxID=2014872 RepID=A0A402AP94_9CHLR|nr:FHA domain-containing serine/threonine-protein kinase [Dictyobacter kobayashii]GCE21011.1 hypothetical protein KDK_48110 [Dictyobacter kobayashii]
MHTLEEGQKFERYRIIRPSGNGATGVSYEVEDTRQQRTVLLKIIHPWTLLPDAARRQFFREMQAISGLKHPQLAPILNYGEWHGQLFVSRIYAEYGSLLNEYGRNRFRPPLLVEDAVTYATQIANTLTNIHHLGYIHGSLTFSNLLINQEPTPSQLDTLLIADAALATFVRRMGQSPVAFFPMSAAPEQFEGQTTPASDQYALAVLLYFWLAGRPPFLGTHEEIRNQKSQGIIPSLLPFNANVTYGLENIIRRALSANPGHRFANVNTFVQALRRVLEVDAMRSPKQDAIILTTATQRPTEPDTEPVRRIEPDAPQPHPEPKLPPTPRPEPNSEPLPEGPIPTTPDPLPSGPLPLEPDIAQPIPDATPFAPPEIEPVKPTRPEPSPKKENLTDTEPLPAVKLPPLPANDTYLVITPPITHEPITYPLTSPETSLGHAGSSDILLDQDDSTSRHHALIRMENSQHRIYDCNSASGVIVNGQKLVPEQGQQLDNGDKILIGNYVLIFYSSQPVSYNAQQKEHVLS